MQFFSPIEFTEGADLGPVAKAVADTLGDETCEKAVLEVMLASQVVMPAERILDVQAALATCDVKMPGPLRIAVAIPGQALELAVPKSYRASTVIARLLGEEQGDIPTSAAYDMVDLLTSIDEPENPEEIALIGEVLARAILGVTAGITKGIQEESGLLQFRNSYNERLAALIDPDAEAAPVDDD
tara:strand:+ start:27033 stop:27587 length:555 start_codon:yes stop_codon:yes gene_type:complete